MRSTSYRREILRFRDVWSLNGYLIEEVTDVEWLTAKNHGTCLRIFTEMLNSVEYIKFDIWLESEVRVICSPLIGLYTVELGGLYPWNYPLTHADKLVLVWASVTRSELTFRLTFAASHNFDCIIQPNVISLKTSFSRSSIIEMKLFSLSFLSPQVTVVLA